MIKILKSNITGIDSISDLFSNQKILEKYFRNEQANICYCKKYSKRKPTAINYNIRNDFMAKIGWNVGLNFVQPFKINFQIEDDELKIFVLDINTNDFFDISRLNINGDAIRVLNEGNNTNVFSYFFNFVVDLIKKSPSNAYYVINSFIAFISAADFLNEKAKEISIKNLLKTISCRILDDGQSITAFDEKYTNTSEYGSAW